MIGLEGGWGSGKTTVINFMQEHLDSEPDITLFAFDAWAHERDPLRRSFLESLIRHLQQIKWIDRERWDDVINRIANRRRVTTTKTIPHTTTFGKYLIISALFVPVGAALGTTFFPTGILLSDAPLIVVLFKTLVQIKNNLSKTTTDDGSHQDVALSEWALLTGNATSETNQDTTETPEPTSIDFEAEFRNLMGDALSASKSQKLVLVLDNLDRVNAEDALIMWSTLQTFLQDRSTEVTDWFKKIWIIVPYDKSGLRRLWAAQGTNSAQGVGNYPDGIVDSFIDKSFQIRFEVPPPVLSNWKLYLAQLVKEALPKHLSDAHVISRVLSHSMAKTTDSPTPRELKLYVNQIGSLHLQWGHEFPISHLAYYSALQRRYQTNEAIRVALINGAVPDSTLPAVLLDDLRANLTGLLFNVEASVGEQLLLSEPIYKSLVENDAPTLKELEEVHHDGFWAVLEEVIGSRITEEGPIAVSQAVRCLAESQLLEERSRQGKVWNIVGTVTEIVRDVESWAPLTGEMVPGIAAACGIVRDPEFSEQVVGSIRDTLEEMGEDGETARPDIDMLITQLTDLATHIQHLDHGGALSGPFILPVTAEEWVENCDAIGEQDEASWSLFQPRVPFVEIAPLLTAKTLAGEMSYTLLSTIAITNHSGIVNDWQDLILATEQRLDPNYDVTAGEGTLLLQALAQLKRYQSGVGSGTTDGLPNPGHLLHLLYTAQQANDLVCTAWCLVMFFEDQPDARNPTPVGNSEAGHAYLEQILSTDNRELASTVVRIMADDIDNIGLLFTIIDGRDEYDPFVVGCLRQVADSANPQQLYSANEMLDRWWDLYQYLEDDATPDRFSTLVQELCSDTNLVTLLQKHRFQVNYAGLYSEVLRADPVEEFTAFCRTGLKEVSNTAWASELETEGFTLYLLRMLQEHGAKVSLTSPYQDALVSYAEVLLVGEHEPSEDLVEDRGLVLSPLSQSSRRILRMRLLDAVTERDVRPTDGFFRIFGDEIADANLLKDIDNIVVKLLLPILRERVVGGIVWLHNVLKKDPVLLEASKDKDAVNDFKERVQEEISRETEEGDQLGEVIKDIADILGIEAEITMAVKHVPTGVVHSGNKAGTTGCGFDTRDSPTHWVPTTATITCDKNGCKNQ